MSELPLQTKREPRPPQNNNFRDLVVAVKQKDDLPGVLCPGLRDFNQVRRLHVGEVVAGRISEGSV